MQCASSTASIDTPISTSRCSVRPASSRSGERYNILSDPSRARAMRSATSLALNVLLTNAADTPFRSSASTWSFINEISGEITTVRPSRISAGT